MYVYIGRAPLVYVYLHVMQVKCVGEVRKYIFWVLYLHGVVCLQHYTYSCVGVKACVCVCVYVCVP